MSDTNPNGDWHRFQGAFRDALSADDEAGFLALLEEALLADHVVFDWSRGLLYETNIEGRPYNAMAQSTLGRAMIDGGIKWDNPTWVRGGLMAMDVLLTDYDDGGLGLLDLEAQTAWFAGLTTSTTDLIGGTINKHLYAARTLLQAADALEGAGYAEEAARYEAGGEAGLRKLVTGDRGPSLEDYFVRTPEGDVVLESWVYYSLADADPERPYFLREPGLNAQYHLFDMRLIEQVGYRLDDDFDWRPFHEPTLDGLTPFGAMLRVYENKIAMGGLDADTEVPFGQFAATLPGSWQSLLEHSVDWFARFLYGPRIEGGAEGDALRGSNLDEAILGFDGDDVIDGGLGADTIHGGGGADRLSGGGGRDDLRGGAGEDTLIGGSGDDVLSGGAGADVFALIRVSGRDRIVDWEDGDRIALDDHFLDGARGIDPRSLEDGAFALGAVAETAEARVIYDAATGTLWTDADGSGEAAARRVAVIDGRPDLEASDILLF